jgi:hypothetical protein
MLVRAIAGAVEDEGSGDSESQDGVDGGVAFLKVLKTIVLKRCFPSSAVEA